MRETITANSNRAWLYKNPLKLDRYLRRYHKREDRDHVFDMLFYDYPDEGRKLIENFDLDRRSKLNLYLDWIIKQPAVTCAGFGDQRMGKDATLCYFFEKAIERCIELRVKPPRIVTLGNIKNPPFVKKEDMYFSFLNIPPGTERQEVWIYSSEIESHLPAREGSSHENRLFSHLAGTLAQNHQKLFGNCKLASRVDINFLRDCNVKFFKFISPDKLNVDNIERDNVLSQLGRWLLPKDHTDKSEVMLSFDNQLFKINVPLPEWYNREYSEMFREIPMDKVLEFVDVIHANGMDLNSIRIAVAHKFRKKMSRQELADHLGIETRSGKVSV